VIISIDDVVENDICVIYPGQNIPVDGIVMEGESYVNESMITGESISVFKEKGSELIGGTINENGNIKMEAKRVGKNTTLNQIIKMVEDAQTSKIPIQKLADRISAYFVPAVVLLSLITFSVWFSLFKFGVISTTLLPDGHTVFLFAFLTAITVLVISCPCALGLATPTAVMVGTGVGAENGILIRSGNAEEITRKVDVVLFDKTGTITKGSPEVTDIVSIADDVSEKEILRLAASIEKSSEHSISKAIIIKSEESDIKLKSVKNFQTFPGMGIEGDINGDKVVVGNMKIVSKFGIKISENVKVQLTELEMKGQTVVIVIKEQDIVGLIALFDTIKPHVKETLTLLKRQG
ncbi:MAG: heavy metal translocating P-type ATPase, partial [Candidatus Heimdallarchaeota archaeon]|nr:heavy metal translocating P-type ATPase [Candidatus Heimdallarchaeota archaeon]